MSMPGKVSLSWRSLFLPIIITSYLCLDSQTGRAVIQQIISPPQYLRMGLAYFALNLLYLLWLRRQLQPSQTQVDAANSFRQLLQWSSPFLILAFLFYPTTTDIYAYLHSGAILLHGSNPYLVPAADFTSTFSPYLVWHQTSTYGPVSHLFFVLAAHLAEINFLAGIYLFKLFCLGFHTISAYAIWQQMRSHPKRAIWTSAYLLCPMLLMELVAQAHVDVFLCAVLVGLIFCLRQQRYLLSVALLWIGFLTKTLPVLWLPFLGAWLVRRRDWKTLGWAIALSCAVIITLTLTLFPNLQAWRSLFNPGVQWQTAGSIHNIVTVAIQTIQQQFPTALFGEKSYRIVMGLRWLSSLGFLAYYVWLLGCIAFAPGGKFDSRRIFSPWINSELQLIEAMGWTLLVLFLFAMPWYQPWYATSLVPFIMLLSGQAAQRFRRVATVFCLGSTAYYLFAIPTAPPILFGLVSLLTTIPAIALLVRSTQPQILPASSIED
jgi:alpha-1,6-mannosyltransferase